MGLPEPCLVLSVQFRARLCEKSNCSDLPSGLPLSRPGAAQHHCTSLQLNPCANNSAGTDLTEPFFSSVLFYPGLQPEPTHRDRAPHWEAKTCEVSHAERSCLPAVLGSMSRALLHHVRLLHWSAWQAAMLCSSKA